MSGLLIREDKDAVARLTLNDPGKLNALSVEMLGMLQTLSLIHI